MTPDKMGVWYYHPHTASNHTMLLNYWFLFLYSEIATCTFSTYSIVLKSHYDIAGGDNRAQLLVDPVPKSFQQNSGMLRQSKLVIFSQTASLLLMNAAGRVSVSPEEITVNTSNMCPLWVGATQQARQWDGRTYTEWQRHRLSGRRDKYHQLYRPLWNQLHFLNTYSDVLFFFNVLKTVSQLCSIESSETRCF